MDDIVDKLTAARAALRDEYRADHADPWIIGFSGGKDSTLLLHLVVEMLLDLPPDRRRRPAHVLSNDTRVESPIYQTHVDDVLARIEAGVNALDVPVDVVRTGPEVSASFWFNLLGKGYPAPNRNFRWCTDRMKIQPTSRFVRGLASDSGEVVLLLGVRSAESQVRARRMEGYAEKAVGRLSPHNDIAGCMIFQPIRDFTTEEVWALLLSLRPPWGGTHAALRKLYHDAGGGECPFVVDDADAAGCGTGSARFGYWTCTVVEKDHSLDGLIDLGHDDLLPLFNAET